MSINFASPSYRATSGSDLTVAISPLGLVELADEEFEVHGPRMNRYAANWAWYLGHHWAYRREAGEAQLTFNYCRAFSDYMTNFTFSKGVQFRSPKVTEAIIPPLLKRIWEEDNEKAKILWEMGQQASVTGDCFVKVAYEEPYVDPAGFIHRGKVRIIPLNSSFVFPEFHPHDRTRFLRMKLKYRFWGCLDMETEALTRRGWKKPGEILPTDELLTIDPVTDSIQWGPLRDLNVYDYSGEMVRWTGRVDALATPNHRWLGEVERGRNKTLRHERMTVHGEFVDELRKGSRLVTGGGTPLEFADRQKWDDELVETVAWYVTEGWDHVNQTGARSIYVAQKRPEHVARIRRLAAWWRAQGATFSEYAPKADGVITWYLGSGVKQALWEAAPGKQITPEFLCSLTYSQARLFREALLDGDGCRTHGYRNIVRWTQLDQNRRDAYQMLCAMLGIRSNAGDEKMQEYQSRYSQTKHLNEERVQYDGQVWCPTVDTGYFMARRNGVTYWTGNTAPEGTRQVFTYTELTTDEKIEEYINDELIDSRPNPLGVIPFVHIVNRPVSSSPWGVSNIHDILSLNREFNEKATEISDIINYHASPITIVKGAKVNQLERGPKKMWAGLPADADVYNLALQGELSGPMEYLLLIKRAMHEFTGVPEAALGQMQPISNTSGVALSIQFQPLMNSDSLTKIQFTTGIKRINELCIRLAAIKEPDALIYNPGETDELRPGQLAELDPYDSVTYETSVHWPPPLPIDQLIKLNEIQAKMALQLIGKKGAMRELGEEFPDIALDEIYEELRQDAMEQGALELIRAKIAQEITNLTGIVPATGEPLPPPPAGGGDSAGTAGPGPGSGSLPGVIAPSLGIETNIQNDLVTLAFGTKLAQRRLPEDS